MQVVEMHISLGWQYLEILELKRVIVFRCRSFLPSGLNADFAILRLISSQLLGRPITE